MDEYGIDISPATYTLVAMTEVKKIYEFVVHQYTCLSVSILIGNFTPHYWLIFIIQAKLQRQKAPYHSNCTESWKSTPFIEIMGDFSGFDENDEEDKVMIAKTYNLPVR